MTIDAKICGIKTAETAQAVADAGASHIGFNFYPPSPRSLTIAQGRSLAPYVPKGLIRVGVFVDPIDTLVGDAIKAMDLDMIQLHGSESVARVDAVKVLFNKPVIKAIPVADFKDLESSWQYRNHADCILFDAKPPKPAPGETQLPGGTGKTFDWSLLSLVPPDMDWCLSGGLNPGNVAQAITETNCRFVDVSSGVEDEPGVKSPTKIDAFMAAVKEFD